MLWKVAIAGSGHAFDAGPDTVLLDSANRAGLASSWRCAGGRCGSCSASLIDGECLSIDGGPCINADEGPVPVRLCRTLPRSDVTLAPIGVGRVEDLARRRIELELETRQSLSPHIVRLQFKQIGRRRFRWMAGQYIELLLADGGRRPFSIANADDGRGRIELHVRRAAPGSFSHWLSQDLEIGGRLEAEGPLGTFVPRENSERDLLFVAGGTGLAPIKAMIEHFMALDSRRCMHLYWGTRHPHDLYLDKLLSGWAGGKRLPNVVPVVSDPLLPLPAGVRRGMVLDVALADHPQLADSDVYVCGPPAMMDAAVRTLAATDLPADQLFYDSYEYAPDVLAAMLEQRAGIRGA